MKKYQSMFEASLFTNDQEKTDFKADEKRFYSAFWINFLGSIGIYIVDGENFPKVKQYFRDEKKLQVDSITYDNNDSSVLIPEISNEIGSTLTNNLTKFLVRLRSGAPVDEEIFRKELFEPIYLKLIAKKPLPLIKKTVEGYNNRILHLEEVIFKFLQISCRNDYCTEFRLLCKQSKHVLSGPKAIRPSIIITSQQSPTQAAMVSSALSASTNIQPSDSLKQDVIKTAADIKPKIVAPISVFGSDEESIKTYNNSIKSVSLKKIIDDSINANELIKLSMHDIIDALCLNIDIKPIIKYIVSKQNVEDFDKFVEFMVFKKISNIQYVSKFFVDSFNYIIESKLTDIYQTEAIDYLVLLMNSAIHIKDDAALNYFFKEIIANSVISIYEPKHLTTDKSALDFFEAFVNCIGVLNKNIPNGFPKNIKDIFNTEIFSKIDFLTTLGYIEVSQFNGDIEEYLLQNEKALLEMVEVFLDKFDYGAIDKLSSPNHIKLKDILSAYTQHQKIEIILNTFAKIFTDDVNDDRFNLIRMNMKSISIEKVMTLRKLLDHINIDNFLKKLYPFNLNYLYSDPEKYYKLTNNAKIEKISVIYWLATYQKTFQKEMKYLFSYETFEKLIKDIELMKPMLILYKQIILLHSVSNKNADYNKMVELIHSKIKNSDDNDFKNSFIKIEYQEFNENKEFIENEEYLYRYIDLIFDYYSSAYRNLVTIENKSAEFIEKCQNYLFSKLENSDIRMKNYIKLTLIETSISNQAIKVGYKLDIDKIDFKIDDIKRIRWSDVPNFIIQYPNYLEKNKETVDIFTDIITDKINKKNAGAKPLLEYIDVVNDISSNEVKHKVIMGILKNLKEKQLNLKRCGIFDNLSNILYDLFQNEPELIDDIFDNIEGQDFNNMRKSLTSFITFGKTLSNNNADIKFLKKMKSKDIINALKYNKFDVEALGNFKVRKKNGENISNYMKRVEEEFVNVEISIPEQKVLKVERDEKYFAQQSYDWNKKYHAGKHGRIGVQFVEEFDVNITDESLWQKFRDEWGTNGDGILNPGFHGTNGVAASMITRFGFTILTEQELADSGGKSAGQMLGPGVYSAPNLDKISNYVGDTNYGPLGQEGYVFLIDETLGKKYVHYRSAGLGNDNVRSPEYCAKYATEMIKIIKCFKVVKSSLKYISSNAKKHGLPINEDFEKMIWGDKNLLENFGEDLDMVDEIGTTVYIFGDYRFPGKFYAYNSDEIEFPDSIAYGSCQNGSYVEVKNTFGKNETFYINDADAFAIRKSALYERYMNEAGNYLKVLINEPAIKNEF